MDFTSTSVLHRIKRFNFSLNMTQNHLRPSFVLTRSLAGCNHTYGFHSRTQSSRFRSPLPHFAQLQAKPQKTKLQRLVYERVSVTCHRTRVQIVSVKGVQTNRRADLVILDSNWWQPCGGISPSLVLEIIKEKIGVWSCSTSHLLIKPFSRSFFFSPSSLTGLFEPLQ